MMYIYLRIRTYTPPIEKEVQYWQNDIERRLELE